jgi:DNA-directed RNA polymerase specialized sigma24 family protein
MTEEMRYQFANWYRSENSCWTKAAHRYLEDLPDFVEDAVQDGWIKGYRQLLKSESKVAELWLDSQHGSEIALDQLRGFMFRVVRNAAYDLLQKELGQQEDLQG